MEINIMWAFLTFVVGIIVGTIWNEQAHGIGVKDE